MGAENFEIGITLSLLGHVAYAKAANVVIAAAGDEDGVEVAQTNGTVVLEDLALLGVIRRVIIPHLDLALSHASFYANFVSFTNVGQSHSLLHLPHFFQVYFLLLVVVVAETTVTMLVCSESQIGLAILGSCKGVVLCS